MYIIQVLLLPFQELASLPEENGLSCLQSSDLKCLPQL